MRKTLHKDAVLFCYLNRTTALCLVVVFLCHWWEQDEHASSHPSGQPWGLVCTQQKPVYEQGAYPGIVPVPRRLCLPEGARLAKGFLPQINPCPLFLHHDPSGTIALPSRRLSRRVQGAGYFYFKCISTVV